MAERVDITVLGATGFTGCRVVKYLIDKQKQNKDTFTFAMAGRSEAKMKEILATYGGSDSIKLIVADVSDENTIIQMCKGARIVINCVGPFQRYGEVVVKSCVENGTDYVDITGEPLFIDSMIHKYGELAKSKGCVIVPACGFDSVPADLGVLFNMKQFKEPTLCVSIESYLQLYAKNGLAINFGTLDSLIDGFTNIKKLNTLRKSMNRPKIEYLGPPLKRSNNPQYHKALGLYYVIFPGSDASVVRNTQFFFQSMKSQGYPLPVQYSALLGIANSLYLAMFIAFGFVLTFMINFKIGRYLLRKYPEIFTFGFFTKAGPSEKKIEGSSFTTTFIGLGYKQKSENLGKPDLRIITKVSGPEVGYVTTPICVCEAAFAILRGKSNIPSGVLSPAAAFYKTNYIEKLNENGVTFSVVSEETA